MPTEDLMPDIESSVLEARKSISKIEETTSRIHEIVNSGNQPGKVRQNLRRRDDHKLETLKHIVIAGVVAMGVALISLGIFTYNESRIFNALNQMTIRMSLIESKLYHPNPILPPSQNSAE